MLESERKGLDKQLKLLIKKHWVEPCEYPFVAPVFFCQKERWFKEVRC